MKTNSRQTRLSQYSQNMRRLMQRPITVEQAEQAPRIQPQEIPADAPQVSANPSQVSPRIDRLRVTFRCATTSHALQFTENLRESLTEACGIAGNLLDIDVRFYSLYRSVSHPGRILHALEVNVDPDGGCSGLELNYLLELLASRRPAGVTLIGRAAFRFVDDQQIARSEKL